MSSRRSLVVWSLLAFGTMSLQAPLAFAQVNNAPRPERPDRGLYRSGTQETSDLLAVNGSAGAGWDNNILLDLPGNTDPRNATGESGSILNGGGGISYSRTRRKASFAASEASSIRLYPSRMRGSTRATMRSASRLPMSTRIAENIRSPITTG